MLNPELFGPFFLFLLTEKAGHFCHLTFIYNVQRGLVRVFTLFFSWVPYVFWTIKAKNKMEHLYAYK